MDRHELEALYLRAWKARETARALRSRSEELRLEGADARLPAPSAPDALDRAVRPLQSVEAPASASPVARSRTVAR